MARILSADELKRNQGVSATRRSRPASARRSRSSGGHQYMSTASILDSVHGSSLQLGSPSCRRTPSMFTSRVCLSSHLCSDDCMQKQAMRRFCIIVMIRNRLFVNNSGNLEPIRTKFYTLTGARMGRFLRNFGRPRSRVAKVGKNNISGHGYASKVPFLIGRFA